MEAWPFACNISKRKECCFPFSPLFSLLFHSLVGKEKEMDTLSYLKGYWVSDCREKELYSFTWMIPIFHKIVSKVILSENRNPESYSQAWFFFLRIFYFFIMIMLLSCLHSDKWNSGEVDVQELWIVIKCDYWGNSAGHYGSKYSYLITALDQNTMMLFLF